jgi:hypothetical protein
MTAGRRRVAGWVGAAVVAAGAVAAALAIRGGDQPDATESGAGPRRATGAGRAGGGAVDPARPAPDAPPPRAGPETAAGLVEAARSEAAAGHYAQALALYQRAHGLARAPSTLLETGRMLHLMGRCREARRTTQGVLASSPGTELTAEAQQLLDNIGRCD